MSDINSTSFLITVALVSVGACAVVGIIGLLIHKLLLRSGGDGSAARAGDLANPVSSALALERLEVLERERESLKSLVQALQVDITGLQKELSLNREEKSVALAKLEAEQTAHQTHTQYQY